MENKFILLFIVFSTGFYCKFEQWQRNTVKMIYWVQVQLTQGTQLQSLFQLILPLLRNKPQFPVSVTKEQTQSFLSEIGEKVLTMLTKGKLSKETLEKIDFSSNREFVPSMVIEEPVVSLNTPVKAPIPRPPKPIDVAKDTLSSVV